MPRSERSGSSISRSHRAVRTALSIAHLEREAPSAWLDASAQCLHSQVFSAHAVHAFLCDPFIRARKWRVVSFGIAGMPDGRREHSLRALAKRHWPNDDILPPVTAELDHTVTASCAPRSSLVGTRQWKASKLFQSRSKLGLYEFVRAVEPLPDGHALVLQVYGLKKSWTPSEEDVQLVRSLAEAMAHGFARCFIATLHRRRELLEKLTIAQQSVVEMLAAGLPERVIASRIDRSAHTVHEHAKGIYKAWGVRNRYHLRDLWLGADTLPGYEEPER